MSDDAVIERKRNFESRRSTRTSEEVADARTTTDFRRVVAFNRLFGVMPKPSSSNDAISPRPDVFKTDSQLIQRCMALVREEYRELEDAVAAEDYVETADALTDLLYVVHGMAARIGIDMDRTFDLVHENNMSKLCKTEEEARRTIAAYRDPKSRASATFGDHKSVAYRQAEDGDTAYWIVYDTDSEKILKSCEWKDVDLSGACGMPSIGGV